MQAVDGHDDGVAFRIDAPKDGVGADDPCLVGAAEGRSRLTGVHGGLDECRAGGSRAEPQAGVGVQRGEALSGE